VAVEEIYTMTRDELLATLNAYKTIHAQTEQLIAYYERELKKLEDLQEES
jgi:hypothetical protein